MNFTKQFKVGRPLPAEDRQFNHCRNTLCSNFAVPALIPDDFGGYRNNESYTLSGSEREKVLKCTFCHDRYAIKSNKAAIEEYRRYAAYLNPLPKISCPQTECAESNSKIQRFGTSSSGSTRYRCKNCGKTFSKSSNPTWKQKAPEKNSLILRLLINKMPMRRMLETASISPQTLYRKIEFFQTQCLKFAARHEKKLEHMDFPVMHVSVDRQDYLVNWGSHVDRRSFMMHAVASSDGKSGFVFGVHPNFDPTLNLMEVELDARERNDYALPTIYRHYSRLWLMGDYEKRPVTERFRAREKVASDDADLADDKEETPEGKIPSTGIQVRHEYVQYGHFLLLNKFLQKAKHVNFSLDQDPGLRQSCIAVFNRRIKKGTCDVFHLRIDKQLTVDQKDLVIAAAKNALDNYRRDKKMSRDAAAIELIEKAILTIDPNLKTTDRWISHPLPNRAEPNRAVCHLTPRPNQDVKALSNHIMDVSLKNIDRFFMLIRRRISLLERPIKTPSSANRAWHGYSPYEPLVVCQVLDIFRVIFNYHLVGEDKRTTAMRIGLAHRPYTLDEILAEPRN